MIRIIRNATESVAAGALAVRRRAWRLDTVSRVAQS